ncbi:hypothetical protein HZS_6832 [Henneguya salminicola]|nr:hypothetical protein HZS_6832 [Henneguya salminicola]
MDILSEDHYNAAVEMFNELQHIIVESNMKFFCCIGVYNYSILSYFSNFCQGICIQINEELSLHNLVEDINDLDIENPK